MKKADEYAKYIMEYEYDKDEFMSAMGKVVMDLTREMRVLMETRGIKKASALKAIILEIDQKWKAVCSRIDQEDMKCIFMIYLREQLPDLLVMARI